MFGAYEGSTGPQIPLKDEGAVAEFVSRLKRGEVFRVWHGNGRLLRTYIGMDSGMAFVDHAEDTVVRVIPSGEVKADMLRRVRG